MKKFKQQAYYIGNQTIFFVDRTVHFTDKETAEKDLDRFACKTPNRIPNRQYNTVVTEIESVEDKKEKTVNELLAERI